MVEYHNWGVWNQNISRMGIILRGKVLCLHGKLFHVNGEPFHLYGKLFREEYFVALESLDAKGKNFLV